MMTAEIGSRREPDWCTVDSVAAATSPRYDPVAHAPVITVTLREG
jgi:hypothetical protein